MDAWVPPSTGRLRAASVSGIDYCGFRSRPGTFGLRVDQQPFPVGSQFSGGASSDFFRVLRFLLEVSSVMDLFFKEPHLHDYSLRSELMMGGPHSFCFD